MKSRYVKYDVYSTEKISSISFTIDAPAKIWVSNCVDPATPPGGMRPDVDLVQWVEERAMSAMATDQYWDSWMRGFPETKVLLHGVHARWLMVERGKIGDQG